MLVIRGAGPRGYPGMPEIANVALPHMQGALSASQDQITWVLTSFIVAADARRREVYWAQCRLQGTGAPLLVDGPRVGPAQELPELPVYGRGAGLYAEQLPQAVVEPVPGGPQQAPSQWQASAASLGMAAAEALAAGQELSQDLAPLYLRESDAKVPGPRKKAGA